MMSNLAWRSQVVCARVTGMEACAPGGGFCSQGREPGKIAVSRLPQVIVLRGVGDVVIAVG
jgi:hypothetical protein